MLCSLAVTLTSFYLQVKMKSFIMCFTRALFFFFFFLPISHLCSRVHTCDMTKLFTLTWHFMTGMTSEGVLHFTALLLALPLRKTVPKY